MSFCKETCYKQVSIKISKIKHITNYLKPENRNIRKTRVQVVIPFLSVCLSICLNVSLSLYFHTTTQYQSINKSAPSERVETISACLPSMLILCIAFPSARSLSVQYSWFLTGSNATAIGRLCVTSGAITWTSPVDKST